MGAEPPMIDPNANLSMLSHTSISNNRTLNKIEPYKPPEEHDLAKPVKISGGWV